VFHHALDYAVELEELSANPLDRVNLRRPKSTDEIDRRAVLNPAQARELLTAVTYWPDSGADVGGDVRLHVLRRPASG
jgi:hypothetical protein